MCIRDSTQPALVVADLAGEDRLEGLTPVVTVRLPEPHLEGQTKDVLGTPPVARLVTKIVEKQLSDFLSSTKAAQRGQARSFICLLSSSRCL